MYTDNGHKGTFSRREECPFVPVLSITALERALDDLADQLAAMPEVERVILFGSHVTGRRFG